MKIEIMHAVTTIKVKNQIYYKIQDIAESYTASHRLHKVESNINLLTSQQIIDYKRKPYYKYNSADYICKKDLIDLVKQRIERLESISECKCRGRAPKKFDIASAIWARDNLSIDINIQLIVGSSNRSNNSVNRNAKKRIKGSIKVMPK
jgi:hypothetical protein